MRPRIGIPPSLDEGRLRPGRRLHYVDSAYAEAVVEAGGAPVYLPQAGAVTDALAAADGLLIPGGGDFPPPEGAAYPESVRFALVPREQLDFDRALLAEARAREMPVLGVCYGMQLLALECGAGLLPHLPIDLPGAGEHRFADPAARHAVALEPGTVLARAFGCLAIEVNSRHHQAVSGAGRGLRVAARARDGVIEAVEAERTAAGDPFVVGVQWHPEGMERAHRLAVFGALVEAVERRRRA
jgi:putative glutamine amidotransferase